MNAVALKVSETDEQRLFGGIFRKLFFSSLLAIVCGCIGQIVGNIVVGNVLGEEKLAVMSLILPVYYIFATLGNVAGIGGSALCATLIGNREPEKCKKAFTVTYIFTLVTCVFFSVLVLVFLDGIVGLLGTPPELYEDVKDYCAISAIGGVFTAGVYLSFNFLRLDSRSVATTCTFVIMAVVNVALDFLLAPMGVKGIAIAGIVGSAASTVFGLVILATRSKTLCLCRVKVKEIFSLSGDLLKVGSPGATENGAILLRSYLFNQLITVMVGAAALSTLSIVNSINSFSQAITVGSAGALVPLIGVFSAERDTVSMRRAAGVAMKLGGVLLVIFIGLLVAFAPTVAGIFGVSQGMEEAATAVRLFAVSLPFALINNVLIYVHLANRHTLISNILTVLRCFVMAVGCALVMMKVLGTVGLWLSFLACEVTTLIAAAICHLVTRKKNKNLSLFLLLDTTFEKKGSSIALTTADDDASIAEAMDKLQDFCDQNNLLPKRAMVITMALDEMLHMAAEHSTRPSNNHAISVRVVVVQDVVVLRLRYIGELFNPIAYYEEKKTDQNDVDAMLELADCLGMKMVTDICDVVDYRTTFGINNLTIIT